MYNQFKQHNENKLSSLGVGQINLIKSWLDEMKVKNYVINNDLTIEVNGKVDLSNKNLTEFPDYIQFKDIDGYFSCSHNNLISLRGCPRNVLSNFECYKNQLTSLEGCPTYVYGNFWCLDNKKQFTVDEVSKYCHVYLEIFV